MAKYSAQPSLVTQGMKAHVYGTCLQFCGHNIYRPLSSQIKPIFTPDLHHLQSGQYLEKPQNVNRAFHPGCVKHSSRTSRTVFQFHLYVWDLFTACILQAGLATMHRTITWSWLWDTYALHWLCVWFCRSYVIAEWSVLFCTMGLTLPYHAMCCWNVEN